MTTDKARSTGRCAAAVLHSSTPSLSVHVLTVPTTPTKLTYSLDPLGPLQKYLPTQRSTRSAPFKSGPAACEALSRAIAQHRIQHIRMHPAHR
mgnify:CR=1 FL=1|jgi:hypothetical protein